MQRRWDGGRWLGAAYALLCLALVSTFLAFGSSFELDPDDYSGAYYAQDIPRRQWVMAASLVVPILAALAALIAMFIGPRSWARIEPAAIVLLTCWLIGIDAVDSAKSFSQLP